MRRHKPDALNLYTRPSKLKRRNHQPSNSSVAVGILVTVVILVTVGILVIGARLGILETVGILVAGIRLVFIVMFQ